MEKKSVIVSFLILVFGIIVGIVMKNFLGFAIVGGCMTPDQIREECSKIENSTTETCSGYWWKGCWTIHGQSNPEDKANYKIIHGTTFEVDDEKRNNACETDSDCLWLVDEYIDVGNGKVKFDLYDKIKCIDQSDIIKFNMVESEDTGNKIWYWLYEPVEVDSEFLNSIPYDSNDGWHNIFIKGKSGIEYVRNGKLVMRKFGGTNRLIVNGYPSDKYDDLVIFNYKDSIYAFKKTGNIIEYSDRTCLYNVRNYKLYTTISNCYYFPLTGRCKLINYEKKDNCNTIGGERV